MKDIKKILVAIDLDDESMEVLEYGMTLGLILNAKVKCIHVSRPRPVDIIEDKNSMDQSLNDDLGLPFNIEDLLEEDLVALRHLIDNVKVRIGAKNFPIESGVVSGFPVSGILTEAESWNASLIIAGMHKNPFEQGKSSIVSSLVDQAKVSVIIVPSSYINRNLDKISVFVNFQFDELTLILDILEFVKLNELELIATHIIDDNTDLLLTKSRLTSYHRLFKKEIKSGIISFQIRTKVISEVLPSLSDEDGVDLVIMRSQKRHWKLFNFYAKESDQALKSIKVPLMVWKNDIPVKEIIEI